MPPKAAVPDVSNGLPIEGKDAAQMQQKLDQAVEHAVSGGRIQERADQTRQRAKEASSSAEREKLEKEADDLDAQAESKIQTTRRLHSGVWQGGGAGAAMGAGTGLALGGFVGTLTGGVLAVPLTGIGGLVGAGTGLIHGPWVKLTRGDKGPKIEGAKEGEPGAIQLSKDDLDPSNMSKNIESILSQTKGASKAMGAAKKVSDNASSLAGFDGKSKSRPSLQSSRQNSTPSVRNSPKPGRKAPKKLEKRNDVPERTRKPKGEGMKRS